MLSFRDEYTNIKARILVEEEKDWVEDFLDILLKELKGLSTSEFMKIKFISFTRYVKGIMVEFCEDCEENEDIMIYSYPIPIAFNKTESVYEEIKRRLIVDENKILTLSKINFKLLLT